MSFQLLVGKVVVISGSATGIGRSTAIAAAKNGASLVLHHLGQPTAKEMTEVEGEVRKLGAKSVVVEGDISEQATGQKVSTAQGHHPDLLKGRSPCRRLPALESLTLDRLSRLPYRHSVGSTLWCPTQAYALFGHYSTSRPICT
jgi:L-rhamnose 1-dehydrogenase